MKGEKKDNGFVKSKTLTQFCFKIVQKIHVDVDATIELSGYQALVHDSLERETR